MIDARRVLLLAVLPGALVAGCRTTADGDGTTVKDGTITTNGTASIDGTWTPIVTLKDTTDAFPGTHEIVRPDAGWWVTPIHVNLLADGNVVVSGWSRPKDSNCQDHEGRLNGTSFILKPNDLDVAEPTQLSVQPLDEQPRLPGDVLYCSGHAPLPDGRILYMGGARYAYLGDVEYPNAFNQREYGLPYARIYDPKTSTFSVVAQNNPGDPEPADAAQWTQEPNHPNEPNIPPPTPTGGLPYEPGMMWYPTNTRLPGGKVLTNGGYMRWIDMFSPKKWSYLNRSVTMFDPTLLDTGADPWSVWVHHKFAPREVGIDTFDYPRVFLLPTPVTVNGIAREVAIYGGLAYDPNDQGYQPGLTFLSLDPAVPEDQRFASTAHSRRPNGGNGNAGKLIETTSTMLETGEIVIMGGGNDGQKEGQRIDIYNPYTDQWTSIDSQVTRHKGASVLLPDGTILFANGEIFYDVNKNVGDRRQPTIFDPKTGSVKTLAAWPNDNSMRGYHNVALLLKDGRVLIGGGRIYDKINNNAQEGAYRIGCERPELRLFSPPYLHLGARPVIVGNDAAIEIKAGGEPFTVEFDGPAPRAERGVAMMALGAFTHSFDQNQRYIHLDFTVVDEHKVLISPPKDHQIAPEGEYNLFLVSNEGVPSVGHSLKVTF